MRASAKRAPLANNLSSEDQSVLECGAFTCANREQGAVGDAALHAQPLLPESGEMVLYLSQMGKPDRVARSFASNYLWRLNAIHTNSDQRLCHG